ncbi:LodA/GoxA family CTQ-dependent oxidase [Mitsuaria sp. GD03876]|uniref:LodA/GoxA family CTQ-dependent oxidase n=1 Tax=Mitsuaria sp. GD03876 TaxID=2975399 RepID=UPI002447C66D|nr:LodA/GoxA family CTQ-dependent oxidase [Mitsuaria sp. GD03876]MDH0868358.1 LodA/GoxA family CTQ-dependent oxidase [Mitsuaria sp. GD03876]
MGTTYKIFPTIGIARVGNAPERFYIGPESYRGLPLRPDGQAFTERDFRDEQGRLCRQAARLRVYRRTDAGPWTEVTLQADDIAAIEWTVHVANKKASWYAFETNAGEYGYASNHALRNPSVEDRQSLMIDFGPRRIDGGAAYPVPIDQATMPPGYPGTRAPQPLLHPCQDRIEALGELRSDPQGRLLFLGGFGIAGTPDADPQLPEYANNDGWWDDTSDGPVQAVVVLKDGTRVDAGTAWVSVAPPKYAPQIANLVTLWDTIFDGAVRRGADARIYDQGMWRGGADGYRPDFATEIWPVLERAMLYPWVTAIPPKPHRFEPSQLGRVPVGDDDPYRGLRGWILEVLRPPGGENRIVSPQGRTMMPYLAGDNALKPDTLTSKYLRLTDTQYFFLQQWTQGWFVNSAPDGAAARTPAADEAPDPLALTRAVLDNCVGGAFSPGIEMSWNSRLDAIYQDDDPLRVNAAMVPQGPLSPGFDPKRMEPGDMSRYMAVPWQADFNECASQPLDGRVLWWWPAQRPEFVYLDPTPRLRNASFAPPQPDQHTPGQVPWIGTDFDQLAPDYITFPDNVQMVRYWSQLGFVMAKEVPVPPDRPPRADGALLEERYVEVARTLPRPFFPPDE